MDKDCLRCGRRLEAATHFPAYALSADGYGLYCRACYGSAFPADPVSLQAPARLPSPSVATHAQPTEERFTEALRQIDAEKQRRQNL